MVTNDLRCALRGETVNHRICMTIKSRNRLKFNVIPNHMKARHVTSVMAPNLSRSNQSPLPLRAASTATTATVGGYAASCPRLTGCRYLVLNF